MQCEACHGKGYVVWAIFPVSCRDCEGSGISHCCDGLREQRDPGDETAWPDGLDHMEREVMGCADDCCHPSHRRAHDRSGKS